MTSRDFKEKLTPPSSHFVTILWTPFKHDVTNFHPPPLAAYSVAYRDESSIMQIFMFGKMCNIKGNNIKL